MTREVALLRAAGWLVPPEQRAEWLAEWVAELVYVRGSAPNRAFRFCVGAFRDALWLRRNALPSSEATGALGSPYFCLLVLTGLAAVTLFFPFRLPGPPRPPQGELIGGAAVITGLIGVGMLGVRAVRRGLALVEGIRERPLVFLDLHYFSAARLWQPASRRRTRGAARLRRWLFLTAKSALLVVIVLSATLDLGAGGSLGIVFAYTVVLPWALADHRERCPVCLRRLVRPTRIGEASHMFLAWYGTEFICARGHGLLHVPEIPTSCYSASRWVYLDPSWSSLFSPELSARTSV
jgi:hypothetical protein